jgi:non-specific serine/threonine protein kinase
MQQTLGRYRLTRKIGEGGMGIVYAGHDDRLDRAVAIKTIRRETGDERARERFLREARAIARVSHPNICQVYEVAEDGGELFIVMELLAGETLSDRLRRGPLAPAEAVPCALAILEALEALHQAGLVHRDLKPANVFLTASGVKLVDFGLARATPDADRTVAAVTLEGQTFGTPGYMAPEQLQHQAADARSDIFAAGVVLYEMLAGHPPFGGASAVETFHAVVYEEPPVLTGSPAVTAIDRVIHRALAKRAADRPQTAAEMARDLRAAAHAQDTGETATAQRVTRLLVLPFRSLRPDPDTDFLTFSLPDAIAATLSGRGSLVVRSSMVAGRFAGASPDLKAIAAEAGVDVVLSGTLLRAGDRLRVSTQLVQVPEGTILWSETSQVDMGDLFQLQDDLAHRTVQSLSGSLTGRQDQGPRRDVPATAKAFEYYLRANEFGSRSASWELARSMYERCVAEDPHYAPAWARLGRIYRVLAKYAADDRDENLGRAAAAFERALELNPDLSLAHNLSVYLEADRGQAQEAMVRLIERANERRADPELFSGLVHVCRYCGLLEASLAADRIAKRLDKLVVTSAIHTYWMKGDYESALAEAVTDTVGYSLGLTYASLGRNDDALVVLRHREQTSAGKFDLYAQGFVSSLRALLEGKDDESVAWIQRTLAGGFPDPEGLYYLARKLAFLGRTEQALEVLGRSVAGGFFPVSTMSRDPWLDSLRDHPGLDAIIREAHRRHELSVKAFTEAGGDRILGLQKGRTT